MAQKFPLEKLGSQRVSFNGLQVPHQIGERVGVRIGEKDCILVMLKLVRESCSIVTFAVVRDIFSDGVLKVTDFLTTFVPPYILKTSLFFAVDWHLHTVVEKGVGFRIVDDVELHFFGGSRVCNFEVEPLGVATCIDVVLHQKIVLSIRHFLSEEQVSRLKAAFKHQRFFLFVN